MARLGGTLLHNIDHIRVRALPENLPDSIEYSIESLKDFERRSTFATCRCRTASRSCPIRKKSWPRWPRRTSSRSQSPSAAEAGDRRPAAEAKTED